MAADFRGIAHAAQDSGGLIGNLLELYCIQVVGETKNVVLWLIHLHQKIKDKNVIYRKLTNQQEANVYRINTVFHRSIVNRLFHYWLPKCYHFEYFSYCPQEAPVYIYIFRNVLSLDFTLKLESLRKLV